MILKELSDLLTMLLPFVEISFVLIVLALIYGSFKEEEKYRKEGHQTLLEFSGDVLIRICELGKRVKALENISNNTPEYKETQE